MGNYEISAFKYDVQKFIKENGIDDGNGIIETDNGELARLLSVSGNDNVQDLLNETISLNYATNTESNICFKQYLEEKAKTKGVKIPEGLEINISSPDELPEEFLSLLRDVRTRIYGALAEYMFELLLKDEQEVINRVQEMEISDEDKQKIITLKKQYDKYYKIGFKYNGKEYDLLNPNESELRSISPEFADFIIEESSFLKSKAQEYTEKETGLEVYKDAGASSIDFIPTLMGILGASFAIGMAQSAYDKYSMKYAPIMDELSGQFKATKKGLNPRK